MQWQQKLSGGEPTDSIGESKENSELPGRSLSSKRTSEESVGGWVINKRTKQILYNITYFFNKVNLIHYTQISKLENDVNVIMCH